MRFRKKVTRSPDKSIRGIRLLAAVSSLFINQRAMELLTKLNPFDILIDNKIERRGATITSCYYSNRPNTNEAALHSVLE